MCDWNKANPNLKINFVNNRFGMQTIFYHPYNVVLKWIPESRIPSGYTRGIDNPRMVTQHLLEEIMYADSLYLKFLFGRECAALIQKNVAIYTYVTKLIAI